MEIEVSMRITKDNHPALWVAQINFRHPHGVVGFSQFGRTARDAAERAFESLVAYMKKVSGTTWRYWDYIEHLASTEFDNVFQNIPGGTDQFHEIHFAVRAPVT